MGKESWNRYRNNWSDYFYRFVNNPYGAMTQEQYEKLKKWEQPLRWAALSSFIHLNNAEFGEIANIYAEIYGEGLTTSQKGCNTCRLRAMKRLYNSVQEYLQQIASEQKEERTEEEKVEETKKKPGRKKKIDID